MLAIDIISGVVKPHNVSLITPVPASLSKCSVYNVTHAVVRDKIKSTTPLQLWTEDIQGVSGNFATSLVLNTDANNDITYDLSSDNGSLSSGTVPLQYADKISTQVDAANNVTVNLNKNTSQISTSTFSLNNATNINPGLMSETDFVKLAGIEGGATADQIASEVPFTAAGNIASTNVQNALEELDLEKVQITNTNVYITANPGDNLQAKLDEFNNYIFTGTAKGYLQLNPGTYNLSSALQISHPQSNLITIQAGAAVTQQPASSFTGVKATDLATAQANYPVKINCTSQAALVQKSKVLAFKDILFYSSGTGDGSIGFDVQKSGVLSFTRCTIFGFTTSCYSRYLSVLDMYQCNIMYSASNMINIWYLSKGIINACNMLYSASRSFYIWQGGLLYMSNSLAKISHTATQNILAQSGGNLYINNSTVDGGNYPLYLQYRSIGYCNSVTYTGSLYYVRVLDGSYLNDYTPVYDINYPQVLYASYGSKVRVNAVSTPNTGKGLYVSYDSKGLELGTHLNGATFSPAVGVFGNNNSVWR